MGQLETRFLSTRKLQPYYYKRFIDDIFLIWHHGEAELLTFMADFNKVHPSISFSQSYSMKSICFLDVTVSLCGEKIATKVYRKPTNIHRYLHFKSSHVKHCKTSIPYSQALRFKRLCSENADFAKNCDRLRDALTEQKYPPQIVNDAIMRADAMDRRALLKPGEKLCNENTPI